MEQGQQYNLDSMQWRYGDCNSNSLLQASLIIIHKKNQLAFTTVEDILKFYEVKKHCILVEQKAYYTVTTDTIKSKGHF